MGETGSQSSIHEVQYLLHSGSFCLQTDSRGARHPRNCCCFQHSTHSNCAAMDKQHDPLSSRRPLVGGQEYSEVKNDDFDEIASDNSITQRSHQPRRSAWYSVFKLVISREVLIVHLVWLLILAATIWFAHGVNGGVSRLPSDVVFGDSGYCFWNEA